MAGVHGLQHLHHLAGSDLTYDYPVGPHSQASLYEIRHGYKSFSLRVGVSALHMNYVFNVFQFKLHGVLYHDDPLFFGNGIGQGIQ